MEVVRDVSGPREYGTPITFNRYWQLPVIPPACDLDNVTLMERLFMSFSHAVAFAAGHAAAFILCCLVVVMWAVSGPFFGFSDTWQLFINTGTTIVTFLMVFLIQNTQNRDGAAIQAKLDELIRATATASNGFIGIEHLSQA